MRQPPTTFLNQAQREENIFKSKCKGPLSLSLTVFLCLCLPPPCRPLSWRLWKMSGHGLAEDEGLWTRAAGGE